MAWAQASTTGQTGLINMPDARIGSDGMLRFGYSFADPYAAVWSSVTILPRLEASWRFTRVMRVPGFPGVLGTDYGDYKDKSVDGKFVLFEETERFPQISLGVQDLIGTQIFRAYYAVASKRVGEFDFTLGYGGRRIDGFFGGLRYRPKAAPGWAFVAEYDANDYKRDPSATISGAAGIRKQPGIGVEYTWGWLTGQLAYTREKPALMAYVSIPLTQKDFIPKLDEPLPYERVTPRPTVRQWLESDEPRLRMVRALAEQDFRAIRVALIHNRLEVTLTNTRISQVSRAVGRAARTILLLSPIETREIRITYTVRDLPVVTYSFFDVVRLQHYFEGAIPRFELAPFVSIEYAKPSAGEEQVDIGEMLRAFEEGEPGRLKVVYRDRGDVVALQGEDLLGNQIRIRPRFEYFFNDPSGVFKYDFGLQASLSQRLAPATFFSAVADLSVLENVSDVTQRSNSLLPHVRTDVAEYKRAAKLKITRLLVNQFYHPAERIYARLSGGLYEEMYGGVGGQVLYLAPGGRWAADLAVDWLKQRDFDGIGFRNYDTVTAIASLNARLPLGITGTVRAGRFLAKDEGVRFELKRRFASGWEVGAWYTYTNGKDITSPGSPDAPYHDKGIFLAIPLNTLLTRDTQGRALFAIAPWTRDVGQMVVSPGDLYALMEKPLVLDIHEHDGLSMFGDREDDYHVPPTRTIFDRPVRKELARDVQDTKRVLADERTWRAIGVGAGLTLLSSAFDRRADRWSDRHRQSRLLERTADVGNMLPLVALASAGFFTLDSANPRLSDTSYSALQSGLTAGLLAGAGRYAIGRQRPGAGRESSDFEPAKGKWQDKSFPSERTAVMWATVTPFAKEYDMPWLYGLAALTNFARVADRKHWVSDTVGGTLLGYSIGNLLWQAHRQPDRRSLQVGFTGQGVTLAWEMR